jgi:hypothetical protein
LARNEEITQPLKPAFSLEDFEAGKIAPNPGWLKEIWGKWPGDETIEELLAALEKFRGHNTNFPESAIHR